MEAMFCGGLVRMGQAALAGAPTLLVGLFVAGVFRRLLGPEATKRAFGGDTWRSLPQAWLWGMLLPVCSLGVIPVAIELRRARLSGGTILAFALTAPLFNPLSLLYGLTLSKPIVIFSFAIGSLLVVTIVGSLWDRAFPNTAIDVPAPRPAPPGPKRLAAIGVAAAQLLAGPTLRFVAIGLAGSVLLAFLFPHGSLTDSMAHKDPTSPLLMLAVAIPAYATPLNVMMQVGGMFVHGNSVGAAFVLLTLGAGVNLGLLAWAGSTYGWRRALAFLGLFIAVVIPIAYAIEEPLYSAGDVDRPHTHAFDVYACPFDYGQSRLAARAATMIGESARLYETVSLTCLAGLIALGGALRRWDPQDRLIAYLETEAPRRAPSLLNADVPGPVLGAVAIAGLIALSVVGCYIYFPPPEETLADMTIVHADALTAALSKNAEEAIRSIEAYDDLTRRLQVGYYLRAGELDEFRRIKAKALRGHLECLKDLVEEEQFDRARDAANRVSAAWRRVDLAFSAQRD